MAAAVLSVHSFTVPTPFVSWVAGVMVQLDLVPMRQAVARPLSESIHSERVVVVYRAAVKHKGVLGDVWRV